MLHGVREGGVALGLVYERLGRCVSPLSSTPHIDMNRARSLAPGDSAITIKRYTYTGCGEVASAQHLNFHFYPSFQGQSIGILPNVGCYVRPRQCTTINRNVALGRFMLSSCLIKIQSPAFVYSLI